jgi:hypothetical protein
MNKSIDENRSVAIIGMGAVTPDAGSFDALVKMSEGAEAPSKETASIPPPEGMTARDQRRFARLTKLALCAADQALDDAGAKDRNAGLYLGLTHGTATFLKEFHDYLFDYGPEMASPNAFSNGVTNAPLGAISLHAGLTEGGATLVGIENCGLDVLEHAALKLHDRSHDLCVAGTVEEYSPIVESVYRRLGWYGGTRPPWLPHPYESNTDIGFGLSEGSVFCVMARPDDASCAESSGHVLYTPVADPRSLDTPVDLIVSGAGAGPQDGLELEVLSALLARLDPSPAVLFPKQAFGETFSVGSMLALAVGRDILMNGRSYAMYPLHPSLAGRTRERYNPGEVRRVLVVAASREGAVSAGLLVKAAGVDA